MSNMGMGNAPPEYPSGTVVKSSGRFVNQTGALTDPTLVTATIEYNSQLDSNAPPVTGSVVRDGTGLYHVNVPTSGWVGPGAQQITVVMTASGTVSAQLTDVFYVIPDASTISDST